MKIHCLDDILPKISYLANGGVNYCPRHESQGGCMLALCYFHFKRAWTDKTRELSTRHRELSGEERVQIQQDLDSIVHNRVRDISLSSTVNLTNLHASAR